MNEREATGRRAAAASLLGDGSQRSKIQSFMVMDVMRAAAEQERAGRSVIHMEVGQPGTAAPQAARRAAMQALENDTLGYTMALGNEALRRRIARHYRDWYGVTVAPERVVVTTGSSAAFVIAFLAVFDTTDAVALVSPGYPCYRHILSALGQRAVLIETGPESGWVPTAQDVARAAQSENVKGLLLASPANPTGTLVSPERLAELTATCREHGLWLISDEIYHGLTYGRQAETALQHSDDVIVINSFSKYFSMTGWRIGWMVLPERLLGAAERLAQNLYISAPAIAQAAALGAFDGTDELEANRRVYEQNRALLLEELPKAGFTSFAPADGAFYLYCDVSEMTNDAAAFARSMLEETGVATTPGLDFDAARGNHFLRFCYAGTRADMIEAVRRIKEWASARRQL
jgi:aspartate/methionine/tyrosine aminotransferase